MVVIIHCIYNYPVHAPHGRGRVIVQFVCIWSWVVTPGTLTSVMLIAWRGTDGLPSHAAPCTMVLKTKADKSKRMSRKGTALFHAKPTTRIGCWNVCTYTLGSLSSQSEKLQAALIDSYTIFRIHSGSVSSHVYEVEIVLSPHACGSWEAAGSQFDVVSERIISSRVKVHFGFATIIAVYAPTNISQEASTTSDSFYDQLQATVASVPDCDMVIIIGDLNASGLQFQAVGLGHRPTRSQWAKWEWWASAGLLCMQRPDHDQHLPLHPHPHY